MQKTELKCGKIICCTIAKSAAGPVISAIPTPTLYSPFALEKACLKKHETTRRNIISMRFDFSIVFFLLWLIAFYFLILNVTTKYKMSED